MGSPFMVSISNQTVGNAVPGVPSAEGGGSVYAALTALMHRERWNAEDGVPYA